jgi:hypothetical protein
MRLSRKRTLLIVILCILLLAGLVPFLLIQPTDNPMRTAYYRIRLGMTEQEVDEIVGHRPGVYTYPYYPDMNRPNKQWEQDGFVFFVALDANRRVRWKCVNNNATPTLWERFCKRLGWQP